MSTTIASRTSKRPTLRIVMDRSFSKFGDKERSEFLNDLAVISGCPIEKIRTIDFRPGCTIYEGYLLEEEAIKWILEAYEKAGLDEASPELKEFIAFLRKYNVKSIKCEFPVPLPVVKKTAKVSQEIVLVHGWSGSGDSFGSLPKYLSERFNCPATPYEYPTSWLAHSPPIHFVSLHFGQWLRDRVNSDLVAVIAHSMGGLVVRKALAVESRRKLRIDRRVKQVTFVASPHNGAALAEIGKHVPFLKSAQLDEVSPNSSFLFELNDQWQEWMGKMVPQSCKVRCIFGTGDKVVSVVNAQGFDPEAVPILGAGHIDIVKPASPDSDLVRYATRFFIEAGLTTVTKHSPDTAPSR